MSWIIGSYSEIQESYEPVYTYSTSNIMFGLSIKLPGLITSFIDCAPIH